ATPAIAYADSLGRTFLTIAHNRFDRNGSTIDERLRTRFVLDVEGCQREAIDAGDRRVMRCEYDLLRRSIHHTSMDGGNRWTLHDVAGYTIYTWDSRDHRLRTTYDALARPSETFLATGTDAERLVSQTIYGESLPNAEINNWRGKAVQHFDQAG